MFRIYKLRDVVRIDPAKISQKLDLEGAALEALRKKYEGLRDKNLGIVIAVLDVKVSPVGFIPMGDGAPYHYVEFTVLSYVPMVNEVVEGVVEVIGRTGLTVRLGPLEGFIHISQVADDEVAYNPLMGTLECKNSKRFVAQGDVVRARVTSVSMGAANRPPRVNMTMRQPYLGKLEWIEGQGR